MATTAHPQAPLGPGQPPASTVIVIDRLAHLLILPEHFPESVLAIPRRGYIREVGHWSVLLGNDRAHSILALIDWFKMTINPQDAAVLRSDARRGPTRVLEVVKPSLRPSYPLCASLCQHWKDPEVLALCNKHRYTSHPEVGRISIPIDRWSARAIHELYTRRADVRLTTPLHAAITNALNTAPPVKAQSSRHTTAEVRFTSGHRDLEIKSFTRDTVMRKFRNAVRHGQYTFVVAANRPAARSVARLLELHPDVKLSPAVAEWLPTAMQWTGRVTAAGLHDGPAFVVLGDHEHPPDCLAGLPATSPEPGTWHLPLSVQGQAVLLRLLAAEQETSVDPYAVRCLKALTEHPDDPVPPAILTVVEEYDSDAHETAFTVILQWAQDPDAQLAALPGAKPARVDRTAGVEVLADAWNATSVRDHAATHGLHVDAAAHALLDRLLIEHEQGAQRVALSSATHGTLDLPGLAGELMPFQAAGVNYARTQRRTFLADEQGLGKTIQALATVEAEQAFPAIVVCPASLKLNWQQETKRWLPHRTVTVITGRARAALDGEILVLNYDILDAHREALAALQANALILDESHYCKNRHARRTQEAHLLSSALPASALRLALTGTPVVNRAKELVPQLRILGRLTEFGSAASFERKFASPADRERLHWHLRRSCYVRRLKSDVLPQLPAKRRAVVPVALSNAADYNRAEQAFLAWLQEHYRDSRDLGRRLDNAMGPAQALMKINALRQLAGAGKITVAHEWIQDFLASGEKLVVFADHRAVQDALVDRFPHAVHLLGADSQAERQHTVERFQQDPDVLLCICSIKVAAHGFTLTAAANVAFIELSWTPADHDQAEDRCHRIGQIDAVTAWYLLAAGTIDDRISALIGHKRNLVGAITDGTAPTESTMLDALLASYIDAPPDPTANSGCE
jgi:superfamily II DNA or RNA helicase